MCGKTLKRGDEYEGAGVWFEEKHMEEEERTSEDQRETIREREIKRVEEK